MTKEAQLHIAEWLTVAETMQGRDVLENYVQNKIGEIYLELVERAANRAGSLIQALQGVGHKAVLTKDRDKA